MRREAFLLTAIILCAVSIRAQTENKADRIITGRGVSEKEQEQYLNAVRKQSEVLYEYEQKYRALQQEVQSVLKEYRQGEITKEEAKGKIKPLVLEQVKLKNSLEYQAEQITAGILSEGPTIYK